MGKRSKHLSSCKIEVDADKCDYKQHFIQNPSPESGISQNPFGYGRLLVCMHSFMVTGNTPQVLAVTNGFGDCIPDSGMKSASSRFLERRG